MNNDIYPKCPNHRTYQFEQVTLSSNFDSGNCSHAQKISTNHFNIWIGTDHPKNNYKTWFHFWIAGIGKGNVVSFTVKNMQNQSRLINQGLLPVCREDGENQWRRVSERVNVNAIEYNQGWIQWTFKHYFKSTAKYYFAFFYPWSNQDNDKFLSTIQQQASLIPQLYFHRSTIARSIQGRPIEFLTISSTKQKSPKQQPLSDQYLFKGVKKPHTFSSDKPGIVLSARVHPGEVPGSHVMTGILKTLTQAEGVGKLLRDQFVFYVFPILNPDGVARGHYRVDTNGINLNRCYLNPSPKEQPSIYAIRKVIMHLHEQNRFFAYLDLHAHASRKGTFIYGNCSNQLMKQVKACLFPKLLSMNSIDFQYEGSNFTEKNMYSKDRGDHISKQGSGRVAMFKATKNANCWTMECNYNISRVNNILEPKKSAQTSKIEVQAGSLDPKIIVDYKQPGQVEAKQFFTMGTYHKLGAQICETFLDLIEKNPTSRIDNPDNYFKSVKNVKMNLAVALLRMAPNRFELTFKKIYSGLENSQNQEIIKNSLKALYYSVIKNAKILNINNYIKTGDEAQITLPQPKKQQKRLSKFSNFRTRETRYNSLRSGYQNDPSKNSMLQHRISQKLLKQQQYKAQQQFKLVLIENSQPLPDPLFSSTDKTTAQTENSDEPNLISSKVVHLKQEQIKRVTIKLQNFRMIGLTSKKRSANQILRESAKSKPNSLTPTMTMGIQGLVYAKIKADKEKWERNQRGEEMDQRKPPKLRKGPSFKEQFIGAL